MSNNNPSQPPQQQIPLPTGHLDIRPELRTVQQRNEMNQPHQQALQFGTTFTGRDGPPGNMVPQFLPQQPSPSQPRMPQPSSMNFPSNSSTNYPPSNMFQSGPPQEQQTFSKQYSSGGGAPMSAREAAMQQEYMRQQQQFHQQQQQQHAMQQHSQPSSMFPSHQQVNIQMYQPNPDLPPHLAKVPIGFPGPGPGPDAESTLKNEWNEKIMRLTPRPLFHPTLLEDLSTKSVGYLCGIGKDVVQELIIRVVSITNVSLAYLRGDLPSTDTIRSCPTSVCTQSIVF